jgi:hypothetical protein
VRKSGVLAEAEREELEREVGAGGQLPKGRSKRL